MLNNGYFQSLRGKKIWGLEFGEVGWGGGERCVVQSGTPFFLSNKIGPFINPLKSMRYSAYSYSCKSKYEQLI